MDIIRKMNILYTVLSLSGMIFSVALCCWDIRSFAVLSVIVIIGCLKFLQRSIMNTFRITLASEDSLCVSFLAKNIFFGPGMRVWPVYRWSSSDPDIAIAWSGRRLTLPWDVVNASPAAPLIKNRLTEHEMEEQDEYPVSEHEPSFMGLAYSILFIPSLFILQPLHKTTLAEHHYTCWMLPAFMALVFITIIWTPCISVNHNRPRWRWFGWNKEINLTKPYSIKFKRSMITGVKLVVADGDSRIIIRPYYSKFVSLYRFLSMRKKMECEEGDGGEVRINAHRLPFAYGMLSLSPIIILIVGFILEELAGAVAISWTIAAVFATAICASIHRLTMIRMDCSKDGVCFSGIHANNANTFPVYCSEKVRDVSMTFSEKSAEIELNLRFNDGSVVKIQQYMTHTPLLLLPARLKALYGMEIRVAESLCITRDAPPALG